MIVTAKTSQKLLAHDGIGLSDVYGKVVALGGAEPTIARPDKLSQVIEVNEQTAFLRRAESDRQIHARCREHNISS